MLLDQQQSHHLFIRALQHEAINCEHAGCPGPVETSISLKLGIESKRFICSASDVVGKSTVTGSEQLTPPWDNAALELMADEHLMHQQPVCPFDDTPVVFISMPNPRRKAKYRLACFYCGRQTEMDWPPPESKR